MNKYVIYTAIFGGYDNLKDPDIITPNIDYICYTDNVNLKSKIWRIEVVNDTTSSAMILNRKYKFLAPYRELKHYDYSLYIDGTILLRKDVSLLFEKYKNFPFVSFKHIGRDCVYDEMVSCIKEKKGCIDAILDLYYKCRTCNMPKHFGLADNKILFRSNSDLYYPIMRKCLLMTERIGRDQLVLPVLLFENGIKYHFAEENYWDSGYFDVWPHNNAPWHQLLWRHLKRLSENYGVLTGLFHVLDTKIKPLYLKNR